MQVNRLSYHNGSVNFGRALKKEEEADYSKVLARANKAVGIDDGKSVLLIHDMSLPQPKDLNTGSGSIASQDALECIKYMKLYAGINAVESLPPGEMRPVDGERFSPYTTSTLSLGMQIIDLALLTKPEFGSLLSQKDVKEVAAANDNGDKDKRINYKNVVATNSPTDKALSKAYKKFLVLDNDSNLRQKFDRYVKENEKRLEPKAIYSLLSEKYGNDYYGNWDNSLDKELYNSDKYSEKTRQDRINDLKGENADAVGFYYFKQFMADEHLGLGRENLHQIDVQLIGDCPMGFSHDEVWSNPKAFRGELDWGLPALNYKEIKNPNSDAAKLLKEKASFFAQRYDGIRFDVGWGYLAPKLKGLGKTELGDDSVMKMIENTVKEVHGKNYDPKNLIFEFESSSDDFDTFVNGSVRPEILSRMSALTTTWMSDDWGSNAAFHKRGWKPANYTIGPGNADSIPLRQIAEADPKTSPQGLVEQRERQVAPLAKNLKLDERTIRNSPEEFAKAKFADTLLGGKNHMFFFMDIMGEKERFNDFENVTAKNFTFKMSGNYKDEYQKSIQEGFGNNPMDARAKLFVANGLDKDRTTAPLYQEILHYSNVLNEKEGKKLDVKY